MSEPLALGPMSAETRALLFALLARPPNPPGRVIALAPRRGRRGPASCAAQIIPFPEPARGDNAGPAATVL